MHTVVVVGPLPPPVHGAARVTDAIVARLRRDGATAVTVDTGIDDAGVRYHLRRVFAHLRGALAVARPRRGSTTAYVTGAGGLGLWYQAAVVAAARLARRRTYFHHHSFAYVDQPSTSMGLLTWVGGSALTHVVLCPGMAARLRDHYAAVRDVRVCSNAGLVAPGAPAPRAAPSGPVVLGHLGNLMPEKGVGVVIDSLRRVLAAGHDARLLLGGPAVGAAGTRLLTAAAAEFGDRFEWVGPVAPDAVASFHSELDVFVFPSTYRHEAEPLVVLEAESAGAPAVAYDVGCLASLTEHLVPRGADLPSAVEALVATLTRPDARAVSRTATRDRFQRRHAVAQDAIDGLCGELAAP